MMFDEDVARRLIANNRDELAAAVNLASLTRTFTIRRIYVSIVDGKKIGRFVPLMVKKHL